MCYILKTKHPIASIFQTYVYFPFHVIEMQTIASYLSSCEVGAPPNPQPFLLCSIFRKGNFLQF